MGWQALTLRPVCKTETGSNYKISAAGDPRSKSELAQSQNCAEVIRERRSKMPEDKSENLMLGAAYLVSELLLSLPLRVL